MPSSHSFIHPSHSFIYHSHLLIHYSYSFITFITFIHSSLITDSDIISFTAIHSSLSFTFTYHSHWFSHHSLIQSSLIQSFIYHSYYSKLILYNICWKLYFFSLFSILYVTLWHFFHVHYLTRVSKKWKMNVNTCGLLSKKYYSRAQQEEIITDI